MEREEEIKKYMRFIIQDICDKIGPRPPCSQKEAECAGYIQDELKKNADETKIEKFYCHPGSYRATFRTPMINLIVSTFFYWLYFFDPNMIFLIISLIFTIASVLIIQASLLRNVELLDPIFKKEESTNVVARFKPSDEKKNIILIGAHHDANWEFKIIKKSTILFGICMSFPVIFNHLLLGLLILKIILHLLSYYYLFFLKIDLLFLITLTCLSPFLIYSAINVISNTPVMGADDNLSSLAVVLAIAKYLKFTLNLKNIEVWLVSHGCEEIGDRGSKRFSKKYLDELKNANVINLDMIGGRGSALKIVSSESIGIAKFNKKLIRNLSKIADDLKIKYIIGGVEAYTDSMAYARNKIKTCSIVSMPLKGFPSHYHTRNDTIERIDFQNLWNCYQILIEFIKIVDGKK